MRFLFFVVFALLAISANAKSSRKRRKKEQESDPGMRIAKMIDKDKDGVLDIPELRKAPQKVQKQLGLDGFKLVDKLKIMHPKNPVSASLSEGAKYFNKVLEARAAGLPLEEDIKKEEEEEVQEEDNTNDRQRDKNRFYVKPQYRGIVDAVDRNGDGIVAHHELQQMIDMMPQDTAAQVPNFSPAGMAKHMDANSDDEVTVAEFATFWEMFMGAAASNPYKPHHEL
mmetsp:Transcript_84236/g.146279  ORF Transcript_84236/g.146279 Transcript_84236/m.146279 type:complete len:226 (+) Transcript_84236:31-708(+)